MGYLAAAFVVSWLIYFWYLVYVDSKLRSVMRRLSARQQEERSTEEA